MGRLTGHREWETLHHNRDLADIISDLGYVRDDGKTLIPQPHLDLVTALGRLVGFAVVLIADFQHVDEARRARKAE